MDNVFEPNLPTGGLFQPSASAGQHLRALRITQNQLVTVLDGKGAMAHCTMQPNGLLQIIHHQVTPAPATLMLAMGNLEHRDRMEFAVEKAAELGCTHFIPLRTDHAGHGRVTHERMVAKAQAALVQSGRTWLMEIGTSSTVDTVVASIPANSLVIVGDMVGLPPSTAAITGTGDLVVIVGPEGGFSRREEGVLDSLGETCSLYKWCITKTRLRAETAAVSLISVAVALRDAPMPIG